MQFVWDEAKRISNLEKHGLHFADAHRVFAGAMIVFEDMRESYGEQRMIGLGMLDSLVVVVVHLEDDNTIRVVSRRGGTKRETALYFQQLY
jgi:uncharacterized DUF497 family protein